jgi:hypothetical protein
MAETHCTYPSKRCPLDTCRAQHEKWSDHEAGLRMVDEGCPNDGPTLEARKPLCPYPEDKESSTTD